MITIECCVCFFLKQKFSDLKELLMRNCCAQLPASCFITLVQIGGKTQLLGEITMICQNFRLPLFQVSEANLE